MLENCIDSCIIFSYRISINWNKYNYNISYEYSFLVVYNSRDIFYDYIFKETLCILCIHLIIIHVVEIDCNDFYVNNEWKNV